MSKAQILSDIWFSKSGLSIENVFGRAAWAKFEELQPNDVIVVVGNGPVCSHDHGEYIDKAKLVIRCNHYSQFTSSEEGRRKIGSKCASPSVRDCMSAPHCLLFKLDYETPGGPLFTDAPTRRFSSRSKLYKTYAATKP